MPTTYQTHFHGASPRGYFTGEGLPGKRVALTFDDGPCDATISLLAEMEKLGVKGTFFMIGDQITASPNARSVAESAVELGHCVGNHTMTHAFLPKVSAKRIGEELDKCSNELPAGATKLFRPPNGCMDEKVDAALSKRGLTPVLWNVTSRDWATKDPNKIVSTILSGLSSGLTNVILLHDGDAKNKRDTIATVHAIKILVPILQGSGYEFVTIPQLMP
jgi:peptidoglycan/xylan/chitin deacetylase (PgdA/CDA1 family)